MKKIFFILSAAASLMNTSVWGQEMSVKEFLARYAEEQPVMIDRPLLLKEDITLNHPAGVFFLPGGKIKQGAQAKLTLQGAWQANGNMEIFSGFTPGQVTLPAATPAVIPQWWGAKGDRKQDDSLPIQCAINSGVSTISLSAGHYRIAKTLNMTNFAHGIHFIGSGMNDNGTILIGETKGITIDLTGTPYADLRDFKIVGGETDASTIGILFARSPKVQFVEFSSMTNVAVFLPHIPEANGGKGSIAVYNFAAELWRAYNIYLWADVGIVFTGYNVYNVKSPYSEIGAYPSMSECTIGGASTIKGVYGPCVVLENTFRITFENTYFSGHPVKKDAPFFPYAIAMVTPGCFQQAINITGHLERHGGGWLQNQINLTGLYIEGTGAPAKNGAILNTGSINQGMIDIKSWLDLPKEEAVLLQAGTPGGSFTNLEIQMGDKDRIEVPTQGFSGNVIKTLLPVEDARKRIHTAPNANYTIYAQDDKLVIKPRK